MKTSTFSGAFAGAFDCVRLVVVNKIPARDDDWANKTALVNGARSIFRLKKTKNLLLSKKRNCVVRKKIII